MKLFALFSMLMLSSVHSAEEVDLWHEGKITPEQPFKALVIGVRPGWGGDTIFLQEIDGEGRYALLYLFQGFGRYQVYSKEEFEKEKTSARFTGTTFISPGVEVERFSWSMGIHKNGKAFGDEDHVRIHYEPKIFKVGETSPEKEPVERSEGSKSKD